MRKILCLGLLWICFSLRAATVPVIYGTDLFHPHEDPDDHFDLATLFALPELDVKAIILDQAVRQMKTPGAIPLRHMFRLGGKQVPFAVGLGAKLASPGDDGRKQPAEFQAGVELILKVLRDSPEPVTIIMAGSVRDLCAAWNREPDLFRKKAGRLYLNIGNAKDGGSEYNVDLDAKAYCGILRSGLPIYLCFCMPMGNPPGEEKIYSTWWHFKQADVLENAPRPLQNFFIYALQRPAPEELDPDKALDMDLRAWHRLVWDMGRNMWCTGPFLHAAGRSIYKTQSSWTLKPDSGGTAQKLFEFVPARIEVDDTGRTKKSLGDAQPNMHLFKVTAPESYGPAMRDVIREMLRDWKVPAR